MPALIYIHDLDCQPRSNLNDVRIAEDLDGCVAADILETFTQSTIQIILLKTLRVKLNVIRLLNVSNSNPTYQKTLRLGSEMGVAVRSHTTLIQSYMSSPTTERWIRRLYRFDLSG